MGNEDTSAPRRPGRPAQQPADRKSAFMRFRTRAGLAERLEKAASISGRAVSEEVEHRLEQSFSLNEAVREAGKNAADSMHSKHVAMSGGPEGWEAGRIFGKEFSVALARASRKYNLSEKWYNNSEVVNYIQEAMAKSLTEIVEKTADLERWLEQARRPLTDEEIERISATLDAPPVWELARASSTDDMSQEHGSEKPEATKSDKEVRKNK